jgi:hypothetical protein
MTTEQSNIPGSRVSLVHAGLALPWIAEAIDHVPAGTAKFALDATWAMFIAGLVAAVAAIVVGVVELRAGRPR